MGRIRDHVRRGHLADHPTEENFLAPFVPLFDVTWGGVVDDVSTIASIYLLQPDADTKQTFGFEREIVLAYSPFPRLEPRLAQLVERFMNRLPARGRVESLCFIVVADDMNVRQHVGDFMTSSVETKTIIPFSRIELDSGADHRFVRNRMAQSLFARDLFDISQALVEDTYFFGRQSLVQALVDRFRRGQNAGMFGLRKTGKTSVIAKVGRTIDEGHIGYQIILDAQDPAIYKQRWWQLLGTIVDRIATASGIQPTRGLEPFQSAETAAGGFSASVNFILSNLPEARTRIQIVVDEFEYICPEFSLEKHWVDDFLPLWQTIRAYQTRVAPRLSCLVVGVNPKAIEDTRVDRHDNPLFGFIPRLFIPTFTESETKEMIETLGRYMGIDFTSDTAGYLCSRYGGHPMLIRLACSAMHRRFANAGMPRPCEVSVESLSANETERDGALAPYAKHILDVLTTWYPLEYEMLEMLALGHTAAYKELAEGDPQLREHLEGYGLAKLGQAEAANGMIIDYVRPTAQRRTRGDDAAKDRRPAPSAVQVWTAELERLSDAVVWSRTYCQEVAESLGVALIFDDDKIRVGAKLADLRVAPLSRSRQLFENAVNTLQQLFWDSMDGPARQAAKDRYPALYTVANVVRCLRHYFHHPELHDPAVRDVVIGYIQREIGGIPTTEKGLC
jgi:hypothetical protein